MFAELSEGDEERLQSAMVELRPREKDHYGLSVWLSNNQTEESRILTNAAICFREKCKRISAIRFKRTAVPDTLENRREPAELSLSCIAELHHCIYLHNDHDVKLLAINVLEAARQIRRTKTEVETLVEKTAQGCLTLPKYDLPKIKPWVNKNDKLRAHFIRLKK